MRKPLRTLPDHDRPARAPSTDGASRDAPSEVTRTVSADPPGSPSQDVEQVFDALVIAGGPRGRTALTRLLRALEWRRTRGGFFEIADVDGAQKALEAVGRVASSAGEGRSVPSAPAEARFAVLLSRPESKDWWRAWLAADGGVSAPAERPTGWARSTERLDAAALLRLVLASGMGPAQYASLTTGALRHVATVGSMLDALGQLLRAGRLEQVDRALRWRILAAIDAHGALADEPALLGWIDAYLHEVPAGESIAGLRLRTAERRLHLGDGSGLRDAIGGDAAALPFLPVFEALLPAHAGRFDETATAFPPAWKTLCGLLRKRHSFAPSSVLQWYPLALIVRPDAAAWTAARKFCVGASGSRTPPPFDAWGLWAHAIAVRLGDVRLDPTAFEPLPEYAHVRQDPDRLADRLVLAAWLGHAPKGWTSDLRQSLVTALHVRGLSWKADLVAHACAHLGWPEPLRPADAPPRWPVAYFRVRGDAWREALASITALGDGRTATADRPPGTLRWTIGLDEACRVHDIQAFEPSASGRGRPKALSLLQLKKRVRLDPRDAAVARCIRQDRHRPSALSLDLVQAALALQGHPDVAFADRPDLAVELVEGLPVLEVRRERGARGDGAGVEHFVFRLHDPLIADEPPELEHHLPEYGRLDGEAERRDGLRVVRDAPQRARLIRVTPAQRRVAELVRQSWSVPVDAGAELDAALRVLSAHFVLHSDALAGERVESDARLVARLEPRGDELKLTLCVRPFGAFGPVLVPGRGRAPLIAMHDGVSLATERSLDAERAHLAAVMEALPFLGSGIDDASDDCSWLLADPEEALAAVHCLGELAASARSVRALEWPKGRAVQVHVPEPTAIATTVSSGRDWFALDGELRVDETRVLSLQSLLELMRESGAKRFVPFGEGHYLRLADALRQRLAELDSLAETRAGRLSVGATAGAWLADAAPVLGLRGDADWNRRAADLERAGALDPELPHGLQATLRPYQRDGYVWMRRLAQAQFGGILADDMGLGKTLQALALLLARLDAGPALVVAPTSVCDHWAAEAARFSPALRTAVYGRGEGERSTCIEAAAPGDLIVVSYGLMLRDAERFAAREWGTLVLDEAQALKNAATRRVQAIAGVSAAFRLALTGTPVENRLADLWSVMNLVNPGLLGGASRFADRFATPIERERDEAARGRLRRLVSPFLLRRTKAQVLPELPPRTEIVHRVEPDPEERAMLEALRREALDRIASLDPSRPDGGRFNVLPELTRLRRAACDPRLVAPGIGRVGAKVQAFERLAAELVEARHQVLVFSQFTDLLALLAERLDALGLRHLTLDGSTPAPARAERVAAFQRGDADLFLISLKAGGFGLNLTAADYVIIADPWWNPAAEDQATGRAHRIGQHRPVTVYRLVTAGSVEERIVALHRDKRELAEGVLAGQEGAAPLPPEELVALLQAID